MMADKRVGTPGSAPDIESVRRFWERNPLFAGESDHAPGTEAFFAAHERVTLSEHSGHLHPVFLRDVRPGLNALDVGCGNGFWVVEFARRGVRMTACDLTEAACTLTRTRVGNAALTAAISVGNAEALPYAGASFGHVNCHGVLHHTPNMSRCLEEFHRVLRPGGTLCLSVYYRTLPLRSHTMYRLTVAVAGRIMTLKGRGREAIFKAATPDEFARMYDGVANPIGRTYTRGELHRMLSGRFAVLEELRYGFPRRALRLGVPDWLHAALSRMFGLMIVIRCRRLSAPAVGKST